MKKYHVKTDGSVGACSAKEGKCPFTSEGALHFDNRQDAYQASEAIFYLQEAGENGPFNVLHLRVPKLTPKFVIMNPAAYTKAWDGTDSLDSHLQIGDSFLMEGEVYTLTETPESDYSSQATLVEAFHVRKGREEVVAVMFGDEESIKFLEPGSIALSDGGWTTVERLKETMVFNDEVRGEVELAMKNGPNVKNTSKAVIPQFTLTDHGADEVRFLHEVVFHEFELEGIPVFAVSQTSKGMDAGNGAIPPQVSSNVVWNADYFSSKAEAEAVFQRKSSTLYATEAAWNK